MKYGQTTQIQIQILYAIESMVKFVSQYMILYVVIVGLKFGCKSMTYFQKLTPETPYQKVVWNKYYIDDQGIF
jgi:hypothetical protein